MCLVERPRVLTTPTGICLTAMSSACSQLLVSGIRLLETYISLDWTSVQSVIIIDARQARRHFQFTISNFTIYYGHALSMQIHHTFTWVSQWIRRKLHGSPRTHPPRISEWKSCRCNSTMNLHQIQEQHRTPARHIAPGRARHPTDLF
jgi:hypothetical protein